MKDCDSDSSHGEQAPYTETTTLLGYATRQQTGDCTKLGGLPIWVDGDTAPSGGFSKCKVCNGFMALLLQVNGDMPEKFRGHERRLYVFICRNKACRRKNGSVRSIRGSRVAKSAAGNNGNKSAKLHLLPSQAGKQAIDIGATLFGAKQSMSSALSNSFSNGASASTNSNPFASSSSALSATKSAKSAEESLPETFASKVRMSTPTPTATTTGTVLQPHEPWPTTDQLPMPFLELFLDAEYETLSAPATPQVHQTMADIYMGGKGDSSSSGGGGGAEDKELFESIMDKTFQRFADRIGANPEQAIRYEFGGAPLLYSDGDDVGKLLSDGSKKHNQNAKISIETQGQGQSTSRIPRCSSCGAARVFEVQLMPHAIMELEVDDMSIDGMEWGTIIVAVCAVDCALAPVGEVGYVEEWCGVQYEELVGKKR